MTCKPSLRMVFAFVCILLAGTSGCGRQDDRSVATSVAGTSAIDTDTAAGAHAAMQAYADRERSAGDDRDIPAGSSSGTSGSSGTAAGAAGSVADAALASRVSEVLAADSDLKRTGIQVEADKGEVILSGTLSNQTQIDRAVELAQGVDGVADIRNRLSIRR